MNLRLEQSKAMGLNQLCLVSPKSIDEQSYALLQVRGYSQNAMIVNSFDDAVKICSLVIEQVRVYVILKIT